MSFETETSHALVNPLIREGVVYSDAGDLTKYSIGPRTTQVLRDNPELEKTLSTFRTYTDLNSDRLALLLTGIVPSSEITFFRQEEALESAGFTSVHVNYSLHDFDKQTLFAQLADFLTSAHVTDKTVSLLGVSFGTTCLIDFLTSADPADIEKVKTAVLMGTIHSFDDIDDPAVKKLAQISMRFTPDFLKRGFMPVAKRAFNMDPLYIEKFGLDAVKDDLGRMSVQTLVSKLNALADNPSSDSLPNVDGVDALFINWEWDYSSPESLQGEMQLFNSADHVVVPGRHGQTATSAHEINANMISFLSARHTA